MASTQRSDTTSLSSLDGGPHNNTGGSTHRSLNANLEKSHTFREGHEGRHVAGSASGGGGCELPPLTSVLSLEALTLGDAKTSRQVELRRAINAATGSQTEDPTLGNIQSKPLKNCTVEELKRVRSSFSDNAQRASGVLETKLTSQLERVRHLTEAVIKLDRFQNTMQSRKRSRPDSSVPDRPPSQGPAQRPGADHVTKGSSRAVSSSVDTTTSSQKEGGKTKNGIINKRMRTSLADFRLEGRPSNLNVPRSSGVQERERESSRPSSSLTSPVEEKERTPLTSSEGWEKTKMKGRRSATIKAEASVVSVANGFADGEREHKGNALPRRPSIESRSRPSEGHGFRSGPVHGITSMQKAESTVHVNGSSMRGGSKGEPDGAVHMGEIGDRPGFPERERSTVKSGVKLSSREEAQAASPAVTTKAKGARGPRSNVVAGANQSVHISHSSSLTDVREKSSATALPKSQVPSGPTNRKRPAPSGSSSPPVASWGSSRPQKMARVARRVNLRPPGGISIPLKEEANGAVEVGTPSRDGSGTASTPSARSTPPATTAGANPARRVMACSTHSHLQSKSRNERFNVSAGPLESEDSVGDGHKLKEKQQEGKSGEQKVLSSSPKMVSVVLADKKTRVVAKEEVGGGDGVRRQGRTGRGLVAPRVLAVTSPPEKVDVSPVNTKLTRSARAMVDTKPVGPGRPVTKRGTGDRKTAIRPRRLLGNGLGEFSGEEEDDHEYLVKAVQQAVDFSVAACPNSFWRQVEPYFAYVTSDDLSFLHKQMDLSRGSNTPSHIQHPNTGSKSPKLPNGVVESEGGAATKACSNLKEGNENGHVLRKERGGVLSEKIFSLSQRLLSAFINEGEEDDRQKADEACLDRYSDSPQPPSSQSEMDYDRRDPDGESDCDNAKSELECWSSGARERPCSEGSLMSGGQAGRLLVEDQEGDNMLADNEGQQVGWPHWGSRDDDCPGGARQTGTGLSDWEEQYHRMSLDDRLLLELHSVGLLPEQPPEHSEREVDEISEEVIRLQNQLTEQVCSNKERIYSLEKAISSKREAEERARERLVMERFVDMAFKKRLGGRSAKGAAARGARVAALALAKRVLARAWSFDAGHSCIADSRLRDVLFCVTPDVIKPTPCAAADVDKEVGAVVIVADRATSNTSAPSKAAVCATSAGLTSSLRPEKRDSSDGRPPSTDHTRFKDEAWRSRARERELFLDDVAGHTSTRDMNALTVNNGSGGIKGKCSELDRDGKAAHLKDIRAAGTTKGERKTKTKPRHKSGPLLKAVKGLEPKPPNQQLPRDRPFHHAERPPAARVEPQDDAKGHIDLSALPLQGMEDMSGGGQQDLGSLFDFDIEDPFPQTGEFLAGLDVPMDDLSELHMLM